jgi:hypothetical protein
MEGQMSLGRSLSVQNLMRTSMKAGTQKRISLLVAAAALNSPSGVGTGTGDLGSNALSIRPAIDCIAR